ncbi:MAG: hypothetical protein K2N64_05460 [Anaeroplasmataceae bacterium]|nr:hypothetical protein [Anaeroplasmataceae bacterium]
MVFFKRYILLFFEIILLYFVCVSSTLYTTPFFTSTLCVFLPFFYLVRVIDDLVDYDEDFKNNKAPVSKNILIILCAVFLILTIFLICYFKLWLVFVLFTLLLLFVFLKRGAVFAKMLLLPVAYCIFIFYSSSFKSWNIVIAVLFFILSLLYAVYKSMLQVEFYDDYKEIRSIGGKGYHLGNASIKNTPAYFTIPYEFFKAFQKDEKEKERLKAKIHSFCRKNQLYAVRSSAIDEDSLKHSFAGIHATKLNVRKEMVFDAIFEVYQSAFSDLAIKYRKANQLSTEQIKMAVIVQKMVQNPEYSGVIYTMNPQTNDPDEMMISIVEGLGEELVSGRKDSKDYFLSANHIKGDTSFLSIKILKRLENLANQLQKKYDAFLDIEFAVQRNRVYFLQARPIVPYADLHPSERLLLIDNSNLIESYYGTTSYLTRSFAKSIYQGVYTKTLEAGHVRRKIIDSLEDSLKNMLFEYEGKLYYNLNSWYHLTSIFPMKSSTAYMEQMMGVSSGTTQHKRVKLNWLDMVKLGICFIHRLRKMEQYSVLFIKKFNEVVFPYYGHALEGTTEELMELYHRIEQEILSDFATPILNDCAVMFYNGRLSKKIKKKYENYYAEILSACISFSGTMESALVCEEFNHIVNLIKSDASLFSDFSCLSPLELYKKYHTSNTEISQLIQSYLLHFGSRVMNELKLETITMIEDPTLLYKQIKEGLAAPLKKEPSKPDGVIPKELRRLAEKTRYYVVNRERLRLKRTYIFSLVRNIFLAIGRNWEKEDKIDEITDIFYLTKEEIFESVPNLKELIFKRKKEMREFEAKPYYYRISFYPQRVVPVERRSISNELKGLSTGKTIVRGRVSIMNEATDPFTPGDIIVTSRTDPGWISLFPLAKGLIVEHGSMLSHSFVVAREMGLPAIVGIPEITSLLHNGDIITLDSVSGVVHIEK